MHWYWMQPACRRKCQVHGMICEGRYFDRKPCRTPGRMNCRRPVIERVMDVDGEIEQPTGAKHPNDFLDDAPWIVRMIDDIVA